MNEEDEKEKDLEELEENKVLFGDIINIYDIIKISIYVIVSLVLIKVINNLICLILD